MKAIWNSENTKQDALQFTTRTEWSDNSPGAYNFAKKNNMLDTCCSHMQRKTISSKWTLELCNAESLKYKTISEWRAKHLASYKAAHKHGWLPQCSQHMQQLKKPNNYWTLEVCKQDALSFNTRDKWFNAQTGGYAAAHRNGWLEECCQHMLFINQPSDYWTLERCKADALNYQTRSEWAEKSAAAYQAVSKKNWLEECCQHMTSPNVPYGFWTLERCKEDALKHKTRSEWANSESNGYHKASEKNWLEECCAHMEQILQSWSLEKCKQDALQYKSRLEWKNASSGYSAACKHDWVDECCQHMKHSRNVSSQEHVLFTEIQIRYPKAQKFRMQVKDFFPDKPLIQSFELDIYIPELRKAIEFNGKYWHGEGFQRNWTNDPDEYHRIKREFFTAKGIDYIEIWEKDWLSDQKSCIDKCLNFLNIPTT